MEEALAVVFSVLDEGDGGDTDAEARHMRSASFASEGTQSTFPCSARHPCPKPQVFPTIRHNSPPQSMSDSPSSRRLLLQSAAAVGRDAAHTPRSQYQFSQSV